MKKAKRGTTTVRGLIDRVTGVFTPFSWAGICDVMEGEEEIHLREAPALIVYRNQDGKKDLVVRYEFEVRMAESEDFLARKVLQRARSLRVKVDNLEDFAGDPSEEESDEFDAVKIAFRTAVLSMLLRLANVEVVEMPVPNSCLPGGTA